MKPHTIPFLLLISVFGTAGAAFANDYPPVTCERHAAYAGRPLHPAVSVGIATESFVDTTLGAALDEHLDETFAATRGASHAAAMTAAIAIPGKGLWQREFVPPDSPLLFWASAGKTFTAVVILQLVEEGKLSLDDPVSRWIKDVPNGDVVTVRDLLAHTSGLFSANEDLRVHAAAKYLPPFQALAIARRHGAMFCPGANWRYSNTGYDLLGEIASQLDHRPIDQVITARIIIRLGLHSARALVPDGGAKGVAPLLTSKERPMNPSWAGAAGPIVSDAADMVRFWAALMEGHLVSPEMVKTMFATLYPMFDEGTYYGMGVMVFDVPDKDGRLLLLGHAGGTPGASAIMAYSPHDNVLVAVALTGDGPAPAVANQLLKTVRSFAGKKPD